MATIQRRESRESEGTVGVSYRVMTRKRGQPHLSQTFSSKTVAEKWAKRMEVTLEDGHYFSNEARSTTLAEPLERYKV
jgi:hypothetical protein